MPRNSDSLFLVQQKDDEDLRDFVARFNAIAMEVPNLNEQVALSAMKKGLKASRFTFSLDKKTPKTYAELLTRAQKYALAEEQAAG